MFTLSKPVGNSQIPPGLLAYVGQKLKNDFYHTVMSAFEESCLSQAELATKMGIDKGQLNRQLSGPSNWTIETVAKMLFAINGHLVQPTTIDLNVQPPANMTQPPWLTGKFANQQKWRHSGGNFNYAISPESPKTGTTKVKVTVITSAANG